MDVPTVIRDITSRCDGPETDFVLIFRITEMLRLGRIDEHEAANAIYCVLIDRGYALTS